MGSMQGALEELIRLQRAALPRYQASPQQQQQMPPHQEQISPLPATIAPQQSHSIMPPQSFPQRESIPPDCDAHLTPDRPSMPTHPSNYAPPASTSDYPTPGTMLNMESFLVNPSSSHIEPADLPRVNPSPSPSGDAFFSRNAQPAVNWPMNQNSMAMPPMSAPQQPPRPLQPPPAPARYSSLHSLPANLPVGPVQQPPPTSDKPPPDPPSEEDEDDTDPNTNNTMRDWDNMFYLAEAARLEADGHAIPAEKGEEGTPGLGKRMREDGRFEYTKRRRSELSSTRSGTQGGKGKGVKVVKGQDPIGDVEADEGEEEDEFAEIKRNLPLQRGDLVHRFKDCVGMGFCDEDKARQMYNL